MIGRGFFEITFTCNGQTWENLGLSGVLLGGTTGQARDSVD